MTKSSSLSKRCSLIRAVLLPIAGLCLAGSYTAHADRLVGGNADGFLYDIDTEDATISSPRMVTPYDRWEPYQDITSIESHPDTGVMYGIERSDGENLLLTIDPATGATTVVGSTGSMPEFKTITFGAAPDYTLYAMVGESDDGGEKNAGSSTPDTIWTIDIGTGAATPTGWTTAGFYSHNLEFNPADGKLYHFYSIGEIEKGLGKIDPATGNAEVVTLSGFDYARIDGITFRTDTGWFYAFDGFNDTVLRIEPDGEVFLVNAMSFDADALDYLDSTLYGASRSSLFRINLLRGDQSEVVELGSLVPHPSPVYAMATDPASGIHYAITEAHDDIGVESGSADGLAKIDIDTGAMTDRIRLDTGGIAGITFGAGGQLFGVAGRSQFDRNSGWIYPDSGTVFVIDKATGMVTDPGWNTTTDTDGSGQTLEFNPDDGLLYHLGPNGNTGADSRTFETINPASGDVSLVRTFSTFATGIDYLGDNLFSILLASQRIETITAGGDFVSQSDQLPNPSEFDLSSGQFLSLLHLPDNPVTIQVGSASQGGSARLFAIAKLNQDIKKLKKKFKKAKKKGQRGKALKLKKKIKKFKKQLKSL